MDKFLLVHGEWRLTVNTRSDQDVAYVANTANEYTNSGGPSVCPDGWHALVLLGELKVSGTFFLGKQAYPG